VSVIVPVFNGALFLAEAIASLRAQRRPVDEIVVVDDGSTDGSGELATALGPDVRVIRQPHAGAAAARNRGLEAARGDVIGFLDADDLWPVEKVALQAEVLVRAPEVGLVTGLIRPFGGSIRGRPADGRLHTSGGRGVNLGCALVRRWVFDRVGPFDASFRISDDTDWLLRARDAAIATVALETVTLLYRIHDAGLTRDVTAVGREAVQVVKRALDRRRAAPPADGGAGRPA
jgi:glycosyltransferase involved in cell wall biosynthesis